MTTFEHIACPDCGLLQQLPPPRRGHLSECSRCCHVLAGVATGRVDVPLALSAGALLLLIPGIALPLLDVWTFGTSRQGWLSTGITAFAAQGHWPLGAVVAAFALVFPVLYLCGLVWVLANLHLARTNPARLGGLGQVFRWVQSLRPWMMLEVYLVGGFVAYSRVNTVASIDVDFGGWCLIAATFATMLALTQMDERTVWGALPESAGATHEHDPADHRQLLLACTICDLIARVDREGAPCPRCATGLHPRKPDSIRRTAALVAAGYLLYIPANILPVLTIVRFGHEDRNTILSGVIELIHNDLWPLAVIVSAASIVLPLMKLFGLTWMLVATEAGSGRLLVGRTRLYRMIEAIGRWSNIDVFMAALLISLLQFGVLTAVEAGAGLVAFAAVVVITMLATEGFDTRLMWDAAGRNRGVAA